MGKDSEPNSKLLSEVLSGLRRKNLRVESENQTLKEEIVQVKKEKSQTIETVKTLEAEKEKLEVDLSSSQSAKETMKTEVVQLKEKLNKESVEAKALRAQLQTINNELRILKEQLVVAQKEKDVLVSDLEASRQATKSKPSVLSRASFAGTSSQHRDKSDEHTVSDDSQVPIGNIMAKRRLVEEKQRADSTSHKKVKVEAVHVVGGKGAAAKPGRPKKGATPLSHGDALKQGASSKQAVRAMVLDSGNDKDFSGVIASRILDQPHTRSNTTCLGGNNSYDCDASGTLSQPTTT
eukprot:gene45807-57082_t